MQLFLTQINYWQETFSGEPRWNYALSALLILLSWVFRKMITSMLLRITHRILHKWLNNEYSDEFVALLKNPISYLFQIGVITGTYSSIFVAAPVLVDMDKKDSLKNEVDRDAHIENLKAQA